MKNQQTKKRAPLNRTLVLEENEIASLKKKLIKLNENSSLRKIENKIINQDIIEALEYLPTNSIDLLFIDPPYNISKKFNKLLFREMELNEYEKWLDSWLSRMIGLLKDSASVYICGDWKSSAAIYNVGQKYLKVRNRITWEREKGRGSKANWKNCTEDIWFFTKSNNYTFNVNDVKLRRKVLAPYRGKDGKPKDWIEKGKQSYRDTSPSNIWSDISIPFWSMPENTDHPTQKPEKLIAKIILASTNEGDIVFDPFLGSGSSVVAAKKLGRKFIGVEIDEIYCCLAQKRIKLAGRDKEIQGLSDGVFWERNSFKDQKNS
ncbi:MAG: site-specific DNA-methyltransferase [Ignavibacteriaceae bacterium]|nr:site-specific DNA-methyltransferase [Ignavibacteriaceae bacterium]